MRLCLLKNISLIITILSFCLGFGSNVRAQSKTEGELVQKIILSLQLQDSFMYAQVFPSADTMATITVRNAPKTSDAYMRSVYLLQSPQMLLYQDSAVIKQSSELFRNISAKGKKLGIHWDAIIMSRYELEVLPKTRDEVLEAIAPERFVGYVFIEDLLTRKIFTFTISEIMKMGGKYYGGELKFIYEANSKDQFNDQLKAEKIRLIKGIQDTTKIELDSTLVENDEDDEPENKRKQVVDRKLYSGTLDGETHVNLYIRYIQGDCPEGICSWEAIFQFGDNDYTRQEVSKTKEGKWLFVENETGGVMELELNGNIMKGTFTATYDKIDYDAFLKEKTMSKKKLESLDALIEKDELR